MCVYKKKIHVHTHMYLRVVLINILEPQLSPQRKIHGSAPTHASWE